ncbi:MAG: glycosyltransferase family 2 protein [Spirochaeta sp.]|jgi:glycosyltransferase involved in cell wall biosynthesis|nr:glycosyltransferase family 2 protein [Spirochaeta sp.]
MTERDGSQRIQLSVAIPCYNEKESLPELIQACRGAIGERQDVEFVFVDNGSDDGTAEALPRLIGTDQRMRIVTVTGRHDYGHGIMTGVRAGAGTVRAWTHADLQTDPADVIDAYDLHRDELRGGSLIVRGKRTGRPFFDWVFTAGMSLVCSVVLGLQLRDINAQPKIFPVSVLDRLSAAPDGFALDLYLLTVARRNDIPIIEYPVRFDTRRYGVSKGGGTLRGKFRITSRTLQYLFQLKRDINDDIR